MTMRTKNRIGGGLVLLYLSLSLLVLLPSCQRDEVVPPSTQGSSGQVGDDNGGHGNGNDDPPGDDNGGGN